MAISTTTYDQEFVKKFTVDSEKSDSEYLYEEKSGESAEGHVIGMKTIPHMCGVQYNFSKGVENGWTEQSQINSFTQENFNYDTDLMFQVPYCNNAN